MQPNALISEDTPKPVASAHQEHFPEEAFSGSSRLDLLGLLFFSAILSFWGLAEGPGLSDHESIVAQGAREMRLSGNWLIPAVNGEPFVRKTPLPFWLVAASSWLVDPSTMDPPVSLLAARLPSAMAGLLTVIVVYALGRAMFGHRTAMICAAVMASSAGGLFYSHKAQVEMVLTLLVAAGFACFWFATEAGAGTASNPTRDDSVSGRGRWLAGFYIALALAMLAKAPLPLAVAAFPLCVWWFVVSPILARLESEEQSRIGIGAAVANQFRQLRHLGLHWGILLFLLIFLPWPLYVFGHVDNIGELWRLEYLARYTGDLSGDAESFWHYLPLLFIPTLPFSLSLPEAMASPFRRAFSPARRGLLFAFTWLTVSVLFLSTGSYKRTHYLATCLPALSLLLGPTLDQVFFAPRVLRRRFIRVVACCLPGLLIVGAAVAAVYVDRVMPGMLKFCIVGLVLICTGIVISAAAYLGKHRVVSFAALQITFCVAAAWGWWALGQTRALDYKPLTLAQRLRDESIGPEDRVTWAVGRPDSRLAFALGQPVPPLFSPLELANFRSDRVNVSLELKLQFIERLRQRLESEHEEYFVIDAGYWSTIVAGVSPPPPAREVVRIHDPFDPDDEDDWVVITNAWNAGEEEDRQKSAGDTPQVQSSVGPRRMMALGTDAGAPQGQLVGPDTRSLAAIAR
jgi:4-amino-4-deoxy-L-arabinose transferase-like glycosyltransferase